MPHVGLSEHDDNLNSVSSQCARGKLSTARKREIHPKKKKKKKKKLNGILFLQKSNHLDFKFYLGKLNNKISPIRCNVNFVSVFTALNNTKSKETHITPYRENFIS